MSRVVSHIKETVSCVDEIEKLGEKLLDSINDAFRVPINEKEQAELSESLEKKFQEVDMLLEKSKLGYGIEIDEENTLKELITQLESGNRKEIKKISNIKKNATQACNNLKSKLRSVIKEDDLV